MLKVSIVIPYWNGAEKIQRHLPKVLKVAKSSGVEEIIASDDASTDNSVEILKTKFPEVKTVVRQKNVGFSSNVNFGVSQAQGDLILLLNSDAHLIKGAIEQALPHFENPKVFSVGMNVGGGWARGYFKDGFFWHSQADPKNLDLTKSHQTLWASGGSGMFRKSIWDELGGLDTLFDPFYEEDVDLGYRATKRGYVNIWEPKSRVEHYKEKGVIEEHFSKAKVSKTAQRNHLFFIWKNITDEDLIREHIWTLGRMILSKPGYWPIFAAAFRSLPEVLKKRRIEKKEAVTSDKEIFDLFAS
jgi:O-antigen biosynthesis protein